MKLNLTLLCGLIALLTTSVAGVKAHTHIGPDLPALGDLATAGKLDKAGDVASQSGRMQEAIADYQAAIAASPFDENAMLGLAHCTATIGNYKDAVTYYRRAIYGHGEDCDIDLLTDYILVLNKAGQGQEAVSLFDHVVDLSKKGYCIRKMEIMPQSFCLDGSDYDPTELQAMTHLMRAMNSSTSDDKRALSEIQFAMTFTPNSALVYFYKGVLLSHLDKGGAAEALQQAHVLDDGSNKKIIDKWIALSKQ